MGSQRRVNDFQLFGTDKEKIPVKKFADGEFVGNEKGGSFKYQMDLRLPKSQTVMAHISWMAENYGLVMLNDLLPQFSKSKISARVRFKLPDGWRVSSNEKILGENDFLVEDIRNGVFLIGDQWRTIKSEGKGAEINLYTLGKWKFEDAEVLAMADSITSEYSKIFGIKPAERNSIFLLPFAKNIGQGRWQAETRGKNITIVSSSMPFRNQALQRLHEQLRHELFHLWIPNRLNLLGDYAWFYEGFAVYQALKTGVWLGQIRFEDFLSTLGSAYDIHTRSSNDISFFSATNNSSNGISSSVYSKGMLVAFLTDIAILRKTKGKRDISVVFRGLPFRSAVNKNALSANQVILEEFSKRDELLEIVEKYIKGAAKIRWDDYLDSIGVEDVGRVPFARLRMRSKLKGKEKALLKKLGYNRWRKFVKRSR